MSLYTEYLNLDQEAVSNHIDAHYGYASYLRSLENKQYQSYIASSYLIAATFQALINPEKAKGAFLQSANSYRSDNNLFWKIIAVCSNDYRLIYQASQEEQYTKSTAPNNLFAQMLVQQFVNTTDEAIYSPFPELNPYIPVGRLGVPIGIYINAFITLSESLVYNSNRFIEAWALLLNRAAERIRVLKADTYHWRNIKGTFIPFEPEILASCMSLCQSYKNTTGSIKSILEDFPLDQIAKVPLLIAREIIEGQSDNLTVPA